MTATLELEPIEKVINLNISIDKVFPKYLYYLCEKILEMDYGIEDWQDWSVQLTNALVPIKKLKDMDKWV